MSKRLFPKKGSKRLQTTVFNSDTYEYSSCERRAGKNINSGVVYFFNGPDNDDDNEYYLEQDETVQENNTPESNKYSYIEKEIEAVDSLANLALRYGCSVAELKRLNKIFYDREIHALEKIKIPTKPFSILTEIKEKDEESIDSGHSSPIKETRTLSIRSNLLSPQGSKNAFLQHMDEDLERIRRSAQSYRTSSSLEEITQELTCKRFHPLSEQLKRNQERFQFSLFVAGALIVFLIFIPLLILILFLRWKE